MAKLFYNIFLFQNLYVGSLLPPLPDTDLSKFKHLISVVLVYQTISTLHY